MRFTSDEIAAATGGQVHGPAAVIDRADIDSRTISAGALFVPLRAERDGHDFIEAAVSAGASAYLTERDPDPQVAATAIVVDDTFRALTALGQAARDRHDGPVIGITGSVAKTSVKDLCAAAIGAGLRCHAARNSFNNELGVPLTLLAAPDDAEVLIIEMGARGAGHIAELCAIARPTIGIVTWVGAVHTSEFGSVEAVASAKAELVEALPATGTAILNADCAPVAAMRARTDADVVTYGSAGDVALGPVTLDAELRPRFTVTMHGQSLTVEPNVRGEHQASNAAAALAAAAAVGVDSAVAVAGLAGATLSPWRMEVHRSDRGATIINDAYNANAISTAAALRSLRAVDASRRVAVLGVMAELGDRHDDDHQAIANLCDELDIELIAYRESAYGGSVAASFDEVRTRLGTLGENDAVLVKASRVAELEQLADQLLQSA